MQADHRGVLLASYPAQDSVLRLERFFDALYLRYDERFVTSAPDLASKTRRLDWGHRSSGLRVPHLDFEIRSSLP